MISRTAQSRFSALAMLAAGTLICATSALAAGASAEAQSSYKNDVANCNAGNTQQDRATCLREAGAALQESRRGDLTNAPRAQKQADAMQRCDALSGSDRDACQARMRGEGSVSGSVAGGGILREIVTPDPNPPGNR